MNRKIGKRGAALFLAVLLGLSLLPGSFIATAQAQQMQVYLWNFPLNDDENKDTGSWGHENLYYMNGWAQPANTGMSVRCIGSWLLHRARRAAA